jgi:hypothetical protein
MTRLKTILLLALASTAACEQGRNDSTSANAKPGDLRDAIRQAKPNSTAQRPAQTGQVAVLELELTSSAAPAVAPGATAGQAARPQVTARVARARVITGAAPKVFARNSGDWEVRLIGETPASYRIPNPLADIEVENPPGSKSPFSQVAPTGPVPVQIVVPLTRDGRSLGVQSIEIFDIVTGQRIAAVPLVPAPPPAPAPN